MLVDHSVPTSMPSFAGVGSDCHSHTRSISAFDGVTIGQGWIGVCVGFGAGLTSIAGSVHTVPLNNHSPHVGSFGSVRGVLVGFGVSVGVGSVLAAIKLRRETSVERDVSATIVSSTAAIVGFIETSAE